MKTAYQLKIVDSGISRDLSDSEKTDEKILFQSANYYAIAKGQQLQLFTATGEAVWEKALMIPGRFNQLHHSDNRFLITTYSADYGPWGMLGPALLVDFGSGKILKEFHAASAAALTDGRFILGLEGYGIFKTELVDRAGNCLQSWQSFGHYCVKDDEDILVFETDRSIPTNSHLVRLKLDGGIESGVLLRDPQITKPLLLNDKNYLIFDCGLLRIIDGKNLQEIFSQKLFDMSQKESHRFQACLTMQADQLQLRIRERSATAPKDYVTHYWLFEITSNNQ